MQERKPKTSAEAGELAEDYMQARENFTKPGKQAGQTTATRRDTSPPTVRRSRCTAARNNRRGGRNRTEHAQSMLFTARI